MSAGLFVADGDLAVMDIDEDGGVAMDMAVEDGLREDVDEFLLHETFDRTGSVCRFIALGAHVVLEFGRELDSDAVFREF